MGNMFSDHFNTSGTVRNGVGVLAEAMPLDSQHKASVYLSHARMRRSHATIGQGSDAAIGDQLRMLTLKSSDRLYSLLFSSNAGSTAADADLGIYLRGSAHDGALPAAACVDAFSTTAEATDTEHLRVEVFAGGDYAFDDDMGKQLWELVNVTASSTYTEDPGIDFDITFTVTTAATVATSILQLEAFYVAGD